MAPSAANPGPADPASDDGRLVRAAWIAARLNGVAITEGFEEWSRRCFGRGLTRDDVREHVAPLRPPTKRGRPRRRPGTASPRTPAIEDWLVVDERRLRLLSLVFELPNAEGGPRPGLFESIETVPGIRHVVETRGDGTIIALGVVRSMAEAAELKASIEAEAGAGSVTMSVAERESQAGAPQTWLELAKREAAREKAGA